MVRFISRTQKAPSVLFVELRQQDDSSYDTKSEKERLQRALENARINQKNHVSPGGGLTTAEEQADAAYADLINTSLDQQTKNSLEESELEELARGGQMWEKGAITKKNKTGILGDILSVMEALSGGAHIVKNKYGET